MLLESVYIFAPLVNAFEFTADEFPNLHKTFGAELLAPSTTHVHVYCCPLETVLGPDILGVSGPSVSIHDI